jgi:CheY-like chemotaxis protein
MRIFLADDDADDRLLFYEAIKRASAETELSVANDAVELIELLSGSNPDSVRLVFLDLNLPVKNGLECLADIRSNVLLRDIPLVIYSTSVNPDDINKAFEAGADFYVPKPASFTELVGFIKHLVQLNRAKHEPATRETFVLQPERLR